MEVKNIGNKKLIILTSEEMKYLMQIIEDLKIGEMMSGAPLIDHKQSEFLNKIRELIE